MLICVSCGKPLHECCDIFYEQPDGTFLCGECEEVKQIEIEIEIEREIKELEESE